MKKHLLLLIALFCVTFLYAQNKKNEKNNSDNTEIQIGDRLVFPEIESYGAFDPVIPEDAPRTNEEIFKRAEFVFEGYRMKCVATYDSKGNKNRYDMYGVVPYYVNKVYKGDQSLTGDTIYILQQGMGLGAEKIVEGMYHYSYLPPYCLRGDLFPRYSTIHFFMISDYPENGIPNQYANVKKYKIMEPGFDYGMDYGCHIYVQDDLICGLNGLEFDRLEDFYNYMKQFDGYIIPEIPKEPEQEWRNDALDATLYPERYEEMKILKDSIQKDTDKNQKKQRKKKIKANSKETTDSNTLTLAMDSPEPIYENGKWYIKFSVWATTNNPNIYLAETYMSITYNQTIFGTLSLNKITVTKGSHFNVAGSDYSVYLMMSNGSFSINFITNPNNPTATKVKLSATPVILLNFKIETLSSGTVNNCVSFSVSQSDNASKYTLTSNASSSSSIYYGKTYYINHPYITNITPISRVAGVDDIVTITGNNFGNTRGTALFTAANRGGLVNNQPDFLLRLDQQYYTSWSNTQIRVKVPSMVKNGYLENNTYEKGIAGTGSIKILTAQGSSCITPSSIELQVPYAVYNESATIGGLIRREHFVKRNCDYDFMFTLHSSYQNDVNKIRVIDTALARWSKLTGLTLILERNTNGQLVFESSIDSTKNRIIPMSLNPNPPSNNAAMTTKNSMAFVKIANDTVLYRSYNGSHIHIRETISPYQWNYNLGGVLSGSYRSFYQAFMHEIGHILMLNHVNDSNDLMYPSISGSYPLIVSLDANSEPVKGVKQNIAASKNITWPTNITPRIYPPGALNATFTVTKSCYGANNGSIKTTATGIEPLSYYWTGPGVTTPTAKDLSNLAPGAYNLTLKDKGGVCIKNYSVTVPSVGGNPLNLSFTITGSNPPMYKAIVSGGSGPNTYTYQWSGVSKPIQIEVSRGATCTLPPQYINTDNMPTSYENSDCKLKLVVTDANGCKITGHPVGKVVNLLDVFDNLDDKVVIYPNPTLGSFTLSNVNDATIYLYDVLSVHLKTFEHVSNNETINICNLPSGIYFLTIIEDNKITNEKLILSK